MKIKFIALALLLVPAIAFATLPTLNLTNQYGETSANHVLASSNFGSAYLPLAGGTMTGAIAMGSAKITGLASGTASGDALSYGQILTFTSSAGAGGAATAVMTLTGFAATDTILSVTQKTPGGNSLPLIGYSTPATNALTAIWSADPGAGSVIVVTVKR